MSLPQPQRDVNVCRRAEEEAFIFMSELADAIEPDTSLLRQHPPGSRAHVAELLQAEATRPYDDDLLLLLPLRPCFDDEPPALDDALPAPAALPSWFQLSRRETAAARLLGFTYRTWTPEFSWCELCEDERAAACNLGFTEPTWNALVPPESHTRTPLAATASALQWLQAQLATTHAAEVQYRQVVAHPHNMARFGTEPPAYHCSIRLTNQRQPLIAPATNAPATATSTTAALATGQQLQHQFLTAAVPTAAVPAPSAAEMCERWSRRAPRLPSVPLPYEFYATSGVVMLPPFVRNLPERRTQHNPLGYCREHDAYRSAPVGWTLQKLPSWLGGHWCDCTVGSPGLDVCDACGEGVPFGGYPFRPCPMNECYHHPEHSSWYPRYAPPNPKSWVRVGR